MEDLAEREDLLFPAAYDPEFLNNVLIKIGPDQSTTMNQEELCDLLSKLDPDSSWSDKKVRKMMEKYCNSIDGNGRFNFKEFLQWCCPGPLYADKDIQRGDKVRVTKGWRQSRNGDEARVVRVVGDVATVLNPDENSRIRVMLEEEGSGNGATVLHPSEVELVLKLEDHLAENRTAKSRMGKELEDMKGRVRVAEERLRVTEERARRTEAALEERLRAAEERARRAEAAVEDEKKLGQQRESLIQDEDAKRIAEEEAARQSAENEIARLKAEEAARKLWEEPPGASRTRLKVTVKRATGLRAADVGGLSDPYCIVHVKGKSEDATHPPFKTDFKKQTLEPVWDQEHMFDACTLSDELLFEVFDHDEHNILHSTDDALGSASLSAFDFRPNGFDSSLQLVEKKKGKNHGTPILYVKVEVLPMKRLPDMPRCFVKILSASNLRAADRAGILSNASSDSYCICEIPGKPMSRFKTTVKQKNLNPEWKEESEINEYTKGDSLQLTVLDHNKRSEEAPLGSITLSSTQFDPDGFNGTLTLQGEGANANSTVTIAVDVF